MKFENEKLGCSFEIPDKLTVRQQLTFWQSVSDAEASAGSFSARNWEAGQPLIVNWQCEVLPDRTASLDEMTDPKQAQVVSWASNQIVMYIVGLDGLPKN